MAKIKLYRLCLLILILCMGCVACRQYLILPDYREKGFTAEVQWKIEEVTVLAFATVPASNGDTSVPRDFSLTFQSPQSLSGILLERRNGTVRISMGDLTLSKEAYAEWIAYAELLIPIGTFHALEKQTDNGQTIVRGTIQWEGEETCYEIFADAESGTPKKITEETKSLEFLSFSFLP